MPYSGYSDRDDDTGRITERHSDEDIINVLSDELMPTADVADELGYSQDRTLERLNNLADEDRIEKIKKVGTCFWRV